MGSLKGFEKLKLTKEFSEVYNNSKRWHSSGSVIFYKLGLEKKVGFTASKKVGNAVKRARAKRRMRALFNELSSSLKSGVYVFVAKENINQMTYEELKKSFLWSLRKLNCLEA